ncbi:hypothetical protein CDL15_Pgr016142 [Punica granatum]|nr:hypothetical protein CDL15_Pgr016142 [Punica granatum]PKI62976.1 hypothetical protein CRG98_016615 [Punica granatum]
MSLVDYASSSDEDAPEVDEEGEEERKEKVERAEAPKLEPSPPPPVLPQKRTAPPASNQQEENIAHSMMTSVEKLPDVSLLLNSPTLSSTVSSGGDHASRVAAAMAESALRKRDSNAPSSSAPRSKVPRGTLPHTKNVPDTGGGLLVPPQLSGRSNVVTEDISKLFARRHTDPSSG